MRAVKIMTWKFTGPSYVNFSLVFRKALFLLIKNNTISVHNLPASRS